MKGNLSVDPGFGDLVTTGELAAGVTERYLPDVRLFASEVPTNLGILHEAGHQDPWIIAMNCLPTKAAGRDYGLAGASSRCFRISKVAVLTWKPPNCVPRIAWIASC